LLGAHSHTLDNHKGDKHVLVHANGALQDVGEVEDDNKPKVEANKNFKEEDSYNDMLTDNVDVEAGGGQSMVERWSNSTAEAVGMPGDLCGPNVPCDDGAYCDHNNKTVECQDSCYSDNKNAFTREFCCPYGKKTKSNWWGRSCTVPKEAKCLRQRGENRTCHRRWYECCNDGLECNSLGRCEFEVCSNPAITRTLHAEGGPCKNSYDCCRAGLKCGITNVCVNPEDCHHPELMNSPTNCTKNPKCQVVADKKCTFKARKTAGGEAKQVSLKYNSKGSCDKKGACCENGYYCDFEMQFPECKSKACDPASRKKVNETCTGETECCEKHLLCEADASNPSEYKCVRKAKVCKDPKKTVTIRPAGGQCKHTTDCCADNLTCNEETFKCES